MKQVITTHSFIFNLVLENKHKGCKLIYLTKNSKEESLIIKDIDLTASSLAYTILDSNNKKHLISYPRIKKIFSQDNELIWDAS